MGCCFFASYMLSFVGGLRFFEFADLAIEEHLAAQWFEYSVVYSHTVNPITVIYKKNCRDSAIRNKNITL